MTTSCIRCSTSLPFPGASCPDCGTPAPAPWFYLSPSERSPVGERFLERLRVAAAGEFEIVREIGHGGMARVYLAYELPLDRHVALKVLSPLFSEYPEIVRRFQHEARTAGQLHHPHIVPVFAVYQAEGFCFFTMPYISGCSLRDVVREAGRLRLSQAMEYLEQAGSGLSYAHAQGVIHRDVKPENMLIEGSSGRLTLTDFGLAKALGGEPLTLPGDVIGTPHYMAPEQCEGEKQVDGRSDQYSLALVAYEMLSGRYPYQSAGLRELLAKQITEEPVPLGALRPDLPERVTRAIGRALAKDPEGRFPSMGAFIGALSGQRAPEIVEVRKSEEARADTLWMRERLAKHHGRGRWRAWIGRAAYVASAFLLFYLAVTAAIHGGPVREGAASTAAAVGGDPRAVPGDVPPPAVVEGDGALRAGTMEQAAVAGLSGPARVSGPDPWAELGLREVLDSYRQALQTRDTHALARLHAGPIPPGELAVLDRIYESAAELQVGLRVVSGERQGERATLIVDFPMHYRSTATGKPRRHVLSLRLHLIVMGENWRIVAGELR